ncbi:hypothetical protein ACFRK5_08955 [Streptomyces niveus]|uniref:hypothetical protein n=1 Tax=Streptomyces niveus TaxID=193462 RepID=UPI00367A2717
MYVPGVRALPLRARRAFRCRVREGERVAVVPSGPVLQLGQLGRREEYARLLAVVRRDAHALAGLLDQGDQGDQPPEFLDDVCQFHGSHTSPR